MRFRRKPSQAGGSPAAGSKSMLREVVMPNSLKPLPSLRVLCIVPIAACCLIAVGPGAAEAAQEIKMIEHATTDAVTNTGAKGDSAGDILTFANEVFDADDKNKIGTDQGMCFRTVPGKALGVHLDAHSGEGPDNGRGAILRHRRLAIRDHRRHRRLHRSRGRDGAQRLWHQGRRLHVHLQTEIEAGPPPPSARRPQPLPTRASRSFRSASNFAC
jgi:hypothetical protein